MSGNMNLGMIRYNIETSFLHTRTNWSRSLATSATKFLRGHDEVPGEMTGYAIQTDSLERGSLTRSPPEVGLPALLAVVERTR